MTDNTDIAEGLHRDLKRILYATIALYVLVIIIIVGTYTDSVSQKNDIARQARDTNAALCTLRANLQQRIDDTEKFIEEHPEGISGISVEQLQSGVANQKASVDALSSLDC